MKALKVFFILFFAVLAISLIFVESSPAPETLYVYLEKPFVTIKKTDDVKIKGDIDGLEIGKSYILEVRVFELNGTAYSAPLYYSFSVEE